MGVVVLPDHDLPVMLIALTLAGCQMDTDTSSEPLAEEESWWTWDGGSDSSSNDWSFVEEIEDELDQVADAMSCLNELVQSVSGGDDVDPAPTEELE